MANYTSHFGSNFPNSVMELKEFKDIDAEVLPYVKAYFEAMMNCDCKTAQKILNESVDAEGNLIDLKPYFISAFDFNWIIEENRNGQLYALDEKKQITYIDSISDIPDVLIEGHVYRVKRS